MQLTPEQEQWMQRAADLAEVELKEEGQCSTFFIASSPTQGDMILSAPWRNDDEKLIYIEALRVMFQLARVNMYTMVTEAWLATVDDHNRELINIAPRDREDRKEVVMITIVKKGEDAIVRTWEIMRDADGTPSLKPMMMPEQDQGTLSGRMISLMGDRK